MATVDQVPNSRVENTISTSMRVSDINDLAPAVALQELQEISVKFTERNGEEEALARLAIIGLGHIQGEKAFDAFMGEFIASLPEDTFQEPGVAQKKTKESAIAAREAAKADSSSQLDILSSLRKSLDVSLRSEFDRVVKQVYDAKEINSDRSVLSTISGASFLRPRDELIMKSETVLNGLGRANTYAIMIGESNKYRDFEANYTVQAVIPEKDPSQAVVTVFDSITGEKILPETQYAFEDSSLTGFKKLITDNLNALS
jgi:hypothetical protein